MIRLGEFVQGNGNFSEVLITRSASVEKSYSCLVYDKRRHGWFIACDGSLSHVRRVANEYLKDVMNDG